VLPHFVLRYRKMRPDIRDYQDLCRRPAHPGL
jgi:hypothetical protein